MGNSIQTVMKRLFATLLVLNTIIIVIIINITITNYSNQRKTLIDMGNTILRVFEASRPIILSGAGNTHLKNMFEEMFDLGTIKNIVIYQNNGEIIFSLNPFNGVIDTNIHERFLVESKNSLVLYNPIHFSHVPGGHMMMGSGRMKRDAQGSSSNIVIAIDLSKRNLNDLRMYSTMILGVSMIVELLIFFLYFRMRRVVILYNKSLIKLKNTENEAATGRLASVLAHEIKNPLSSIAGLISYAQKKELDDKTADVLEKSQGEISRLSDIVNGFLAYGRTLDLEATQSDVKPLINKTCELLSHDATQKNISFNISGSGFTCLLDKNKILQVFVNLLLNAIDSSPKNESISIVFDSHKRTLSITNKLTKPFTHEKDKVFEPFFTTKAKGTGLGLAITKKIIEQHDFEIDVVSIDPFSIVIVFDRNRTK